jgi:hypothetical protein
MLGHSTGSVKVGIVRAARLRWESSPNELNNLIFEAARGERNFLGKFAPQLRSESLEPILQLLHPVRIGC